jgi:hypothetical protein
MMTSQEAGDQIYREVVEEYEHVTDVLRENRTITELEFPYFGECNWRAKFLSREE